MRESNVSTSNNGSDASGNGPVQQAKPVHGAPKPANTPSDMVATPPMPCAFKVGDEVTYTNDAGVTFDFVVRGFTKELHEPHVEIENYEHRTVYIFTDAWWMPARASEMGLRDPAKPGEVDRRGRRNG